MNTAPHDIGSNTASAAGPLALCPADVAADGPPACPFDTGSLLARCVDDREFCALMLHKFSRRAGDQMAAIDRAVASSNLAELTVRAHTLKGVAANLAADSLASAAAELERLARQSQLDRLAAAVSRVRGELERTVQMVPQLVEDLLAR